MFLFPITLDTKHVTLYMQNPYEGTLIKSVNLSMSG